MRPPKGRKRRKRQRYEEEKIHRAVADWLRANGVFFFHVPNEEQDSFRRQIEAALGVMPGVSDILIMDPWEPDQARCAECTEYEWCSYPMPVEHLCDNAPGRAGSCLEIKAPGKKATPAQLKFLDQMKRRGWRTHWTDDLDDALRWLRCGGYGRREKLTPAAMVGPGRPGSVEQHPRTQHAESCRGTDRSTVDGEPQDR